MVEHGDFMVIYCNASIEFCEARDVKGMYKRARAGEVAQFTGISSPYEEPKDPDLSVSTSRLPLHDCVRQIIEEMEQRGLMKPFG